MSEQQQCKVRFCRQVDIVPISPQQQYRSSSAQPKEMDSSSSQGWMVSKHYPSMEALSLYGEESPSPPTEMSTMVRSLSPSPNLSLFERMKCTEVPKPPSPAHVWVPSSQQDVEMDMTESSGDTMVRTPSPSPKLSLFERMKRAKVPTPPSLAEERVPLASHKEDAVMELAESSGNTGVRSLSPTPNLSLFERMKHAEVPKPPSPAPVSHMDLFEQMRRAQIPPPPSPPAATKQDIFQLLQSTEVPSPPSPFEELHIEQGGEPDCSHQIDFGDPDRGQLRGLFKQGLTGPIPTGDECRDLERAGLANTHTKEDVLWVLHDLKSQHAGLPSPRNYPYNKNLDLHIARAMKRIGADIQQLVKNQVKFMQLGQYTIDMIDLLEVSQYPYSGYNVQPYAGSPPYPSRQSVIEMAVIYWGLRIECAVIHLLGIPQVSDWPMEWFYNLCLDLKELDHLILVTVSRQTFTPTLPACFHAYLRCQDNKDQFQNEIRSIPLGAFRMIDSLDHYIPNWTPRTPNKYAGFIFPWWLHGSSQYPMDFQHLRGGRIFPVVDEYFQYTWPAKNTSMGDQIDDWIEGQVYTYMKSLREIVEEIEVNEKNMNHLFSWWATLSGLLGVQDVS
ncbi:hypothetical protein PISMIDRAFT_6175 [Pisolithus microcarpus 441]|uniref:Uncharacterized protein n=1 Tax=Pisolithus microcarpus 441 TaxID=765257 RepID=A0A0D0A933_9AGAM|nr:hypothetical protein PISMIDRAFT_6175 [Pisolithus microcarpus 441]